MANKPIGIGAAFQNKLPRASAKATYTNVFWHGGNNWEDCFNVTAVQDFASETDNFAREGYLIRLPRVVRILYHSIGADPQQVIFASTYQAMFQALADAYFEDGIAFTWGRYPPGSVWRWLADSTPDFQGAHSVANIYAGEILTFIFRANCIAYREHDFATSPNANYNLDYADFVAKHPRHDDFKAVIYNTVFDGSGGGPATEQDETLAAMIDGSGAFAALGPGLSEYGWSLDNRAWDTTDVISQGEMETIISEFFEVA